MIVQSYYFEISTGQEVEVLWPRGRLEPVRGAARAGSAQEDQPPTTDHDALLAVHSDSPSYSNMKMKEHTKKTVKLDFNRMTTFPHRLKLAGAWLDPDANQQK